jgi:hypothetical protein
LKVISFVIAVNYNRLPVVVLGCLPQGRTHETNAVRGVLHLEPLAFSTVGILSACRRDCGVTKEAGETPAPSIWATARRDSGETPGTVIFYIRAGLKPAPTLRKLDSCCKLCVEVFWRNHGLLPTLPRVGHGDIDLRTWTGRRAIAFKLGRA